MFRAVLASLVLLLFSSACTAAGESVVEFKAKAREAFERADYPAAIEYLQSAKQLTNEDAEVWYYLGYFTHYLCYDSVPLSGFDREKSDEVLGYLRRAVELDPRLGNAFYFIGAEYGARAREEMRAGDTDGAAAEFRAGREAGGFPDWMIEFGRNLLRSCGPDAILVTAGDADTNPVQYLQIVEGYRTDVTVIPRALLERPWYVEILKNGLGTVIPAAPISWSDEQIENMHPYKWQERVIRIPIPEAARRKYGTAHDSMEWTLAPDIVYGDSRTLLSAGKAALADILETNRWARPVCFSTACPPAVWEGLDDYLRLRGMVQELLPYSPDPDIDVETTRVLLERDLEFASLAALPLTEMPRVSGMLQNCRIPFIRLAYQYRRQGDPETAMKMVETMFERVPSELPLPENIARLVRGLERGE